MTSTVQPGADGQIEGAISSARAPSPARQVAAVIDVVGLTLLGVLVSWGFVRVFLDVPVFRLGIGAALGAVLVGEGIGRLARRTASTALLASAAAAVLTAPVVVWSTGPTPTNVQMVVVALADAPQRILSLPLPVSASPELVVVAFFTVWLVVAVGLEIARRRRDPFLPLVPAALATAAPVLLAADGPVPSEGYWTLVLTVGGGLALARSLAPGRHTIRSVRSVRDARRRRLIGGLPVIAAVAVLVPALARVAPGVADRPRVDARTTPSTDPVRLDSPLARVAAIRRDPQRVTAFEAQGPTGVTSWRLAVLDRYDGTSWTASGSLVRVAEEFPGPTPPGREVTFDVEVGETGTVFLPTPGQAVSVEGPVVRLDRTNGNVAVDSTTSDGVRYAVTARVPDASDAERQAAVRTRTGADARVAVQPIADVGRLQRQAQVQVGAAALDTTASPDMSNLLALQDFLADTRIFAIDAEPVSGESLSQLEKLVIGGTDGEGNQSADSLRVGSREQFVAALAVMARSLGFATRVVVGYRPTDEGGAITATSKDIDSWVEVKMEGLGWIAFSAGPDEEQAAEVTTTVPPVTQPTVPGTSPEVPDKNQPSDERAGPPAPNRTPWLVAAGGLVGLAALLFLARLPARRWLRRQGDARSQVLGAWSEVVDVLARAGVKADRTRTVEEVTAGARGALAGPGNVALDRLGRLVTRVSWSLAELDPDAPEMAWTQVATVRSQVLRRRRRRVGD